MVQLMLFIYIARNVTIYIRVMFKMVFERIFLH